MSDEENEEVPVEPPKEEVAQIEKQAFDTLEEFNKKIIQKGAFTLDDYAVTPKLKNILDKMEKNDIFDDYLKDKMPTKERELFDKNLEENEALKAEFLNYNAAVELLKY